jgi:hypothetical protein
MLCMISTALLPLLKFVGYRLPSNANMWSYKVFIFYITELSRPTKGNLLQTPSRLSSFIVIEHLAPSLIHSAFLIAHMNGTIVAFSRSQTPSATNGSWFNQSRSSASSVAFHTITLPFGTEGSPELLGCAVTIGPDMTIRPVSTCVVLCAICTIALSLRVWRASELERSGI